MPTMKHVGPDFNREGGSSADRNRSERESPSIRPWWKSSGWWRAIFAGLALAFMVYEGLRIAYGMPLTTIGIDSVPQEWRKAIERQVDSLAGKHDSLQQQFERHLNDLDSLNRVPVKLDIKNTIVAPERYRIIADSLESMVLNGVDVGRDMLLKLGNLSFAVGDHARAERYYWRVDRDRDHSGYDPLFVIALHNCQVLKGFHADEEERHKFSDFLAVYGLIRI